jgi:MerR family redox-sensitive transcriptional activator SoxR
MEEMKIGAVAGLAGVETSTLRYYESIGVLPPARRVSGQRRYTPEVLQRLGIVQVAKEAGFTLPEIRTLFDGFSESEPPSALWKTLARQKLPEVESLIARAQTMKRILEEGLDCDCLSLDDCTILAKRAAGQR